jgi:SAM-dependent methyltransferase
MYDQIAERLRQAYDHKVEEREQKEIAVWKVEEREQFLALLQRENKKKLLEIGAGTGAHAKFFQDRGLVVICTDLAPEMVKRCRQKGLEAVTMDFLSLEFPDDSFDAVYAMNCLLHVPRRSLLKVLRNIRDLLQPGGLFYWGQYGGIEKEGTWSEDHYEPKRFFCLLPDEEIKELATRPFQLVSFKRIVLEEENDVHFQSMVLRRAKMLQG